MSESDPGVPEAIPRVLEELVDRLGRDGIDRLWIFPPRKRGRKEWGLVVASVYLEDDDRRRLQTARYVAERSGEGLTFDARHSREGILPAERFGRLMDGVVRRAEEDLGDPRSVEIEGDADRLDALMEEFDPPRLETQQP